MKCSSSSRFYYRILDSQSLRIKARLAQYIGMFTVILNTNLVKSLGTSSYPLLFLCPKSS
jgi:hypothetical protein